MNIAQITERYMLLKDKKAKVEKLVKEKVKVITDEMGKLEMAAMNFFEESGQTSAKTEFGTPYKKLDIKFNIDNADEFFDYVINNNAVDLLQKRVNSTVAKSMMDDNKDDPNYKIPGVKIYQEHKVIFKK
jgi:hypothetical protein